MTLTESRNILIADDHFVVRQGVEMLLFEVFDNINVFHASTMAEVYKNLTKFSFYLIVLDAVFPDGNTINEIGKLKKEYPTTKVLIYSGLDEKIYGPKFLQLGVNGFLSKLAVEQDIILAFQTIQKDKIYTSPSIQNRLGEQSSKSENHNPFTLLSEREFQIMVSLANGLGNLEICNQFDLKPTTVTTYKNRIFEKLNIRNLSELMELYRLYH